MSYDVERVIKLLDSQKDDLNELYDETIIRIRNDPDPDLREATKIAVDTSKIFMTISLAAFALIGLFSRHYLSEGYELANSKIILLGVSAFCALASMICGFLAISTVYKTAEGKTKRETGKEFWQIDPIRNKLNIQSCLGLISIIAFVSAIVFGDNLNSKIRNTNLLSLTPGWPYEDSSANLPPPFVISGNSSRITITKDDGISFAWDIPASQRSSETDETRVWSLHVSAKD